MFLLRMRDFFVIHYYVMPIYTFDIQISIVNFNVVIVIFIMHRRLLKRLIDFKYLRKYKKEY